jgi:hypothetical protein
MGQKEGRGDGMNELIPVRPIGYSKDITLFAARTLPSLDAGTIGRKLAPESKDPAKYIRKVYERNKQHFTEQDTFLMEVETAYFWAPDRGDIERHSDAQCGTPKNAVRRKKVRFFTLPHGVMKICTASNSPRKFEVIDKVLTLHEAFITGKLPRIPDNPTLQQLAYLPPYTRGLGAAYQATGREMNKSQRAVKAMVGKLRRGEPIRQPKTPGVVAVHKKHREKYDEVMKLRAMGLKLREIHEITSVKIPTIARWTKGA